MISANDDGRNVEATEIGQKVVNKALRIWLRSGRIEQVAGNENRIHFLSLGNIKDFLENRSMLVQARTGLKRLANVPVGCVEESHLDLFALVSKTLEGIGTRSLCNFANASCPCWKWKLDQEGCGNLRLMNDDGSRLRIPARARLAIVRKRYSSRCA